MELRSTHFWGCVIKLHPDRILCGSSSSSKVSKVIGHLYSALLLDEPIAKVLSMKYEWNPFSNLGD